MVNRKPLVLNSGVISELVSTDSLDITSNLPTVAPAFNWNFANGKQLPTVIDFSRNSNVAANFNEVGLLVLDTVNQPRFNHRGGVSKGVLIEASATNLFTNSEVADVGRNVTINSNTVSAPNNTLTADEVVETTTNGEHYSDDRTISVTLGDSLFFSTFVKQSNTVANRKFYLRLATAVSAGIFFNFQTKTITNAGGTSAYGFEELKNGWFLVWMSAVATSTATLVARRQFLTSSNVSVYAGDVNEKMVLWGGQVYISGLRGFSYVKTTTSVTRALDFATVSTTNFATLYRQDAYSVFSEFYGQAVGTCTIFDLHDSTTNNRIYLESVNGVLTFNIVTGGVAQCAIALGSVVTDTLYKVTSAWALNDVAVSINGATAATDTNVTLPTVTRASLGCNYAGANQMNAELARLTGYATRLPNIELQGLST